MKNLINLIKSPSCLQVALILMLTSCSNNKPLAVNDKPISVEPNSDYIAEGITELKPVEVRTYQKVGKELVEIAGANCHVKGEGYSVRVLSPSLVAIPLYGKTKASMVLMSCNKKDLFGVDNKGVVHNHSNYRTELKAILD